MATFTGSDINDFVQSGYDYLYGADGNDFLGADAIGYDVVEGGRGSDFIYFSANNASTNGSLYGGDGADFLMGFQNADNLYGGEGNDFLAGGWTNTFSGAISTSATGVSGNDYLDGGAGVDALYGMNGDDTLLGGDGNDSNVSISFASNSTYSGGASATATAGLYGGSGNDFLDGGRGNDYLDGGADNDRMLGGEGNDLLDGGTGADVMSGGGDSDTYIVDNLGDIVNESNEGGVDTIYSSVDYKLGAFQDNLFLFNASTYATGNAGDNYITGNAANNVINGLGGLDHLAGGAGSDIFQMVGNWGVQIISDFVAGAGTPDAVTFASAYIKNFSDVLSHSEQIGGDTYIGDGQGDLVVLVGVTRSSLSGDDFGFFS